MHWCIFKFGVMGFRCLGNKREWLRTKGLTMKQHIRVAAFCSALSFSLASNSFAADLPTASEMFAKMMHEVAKVLEFQL